MNITTIPFLNLNQACLAFYDIAAHHYTPPPDYEGEKNYRYAIGCDNLDNPLYINNFFLTLKGTAEIQYEDTLIKVAPGTLYYVPPNIDVVTYSETSDYDYLRIRFSAWDVTTNQIAGFSNIPEIFLTNTSKHIHQDLYDLCSTYSYSDYANSLKLSSLLCNFLYDLFKESAQKNQSNYSRVYEAITFLNVNFQLNPTDAELAQICGLSEPYFRKCFKQITKMTPVEYKNHKKIQRAREILKNSSQTIGEISEHLGFANVHYFCRTFKSITGVSATYYRKYM